MMFSQQSYKKLWKLLIDNDMLKKDLQKKSISVQYGELQTTCAAALTVGISSNMFLGLLFIAYVEQEDTREVIDIAVSMPR